MSEHDERTVYDQENDPQASQGDGGDYEQASRWHSGEAEYADYDDEAVMVRSVAADAPPTDAAAGDAAAPLPLLKSRIVQVTLAVIVLLLVVVVVGAGVFWWMRTSRDKPLELDVYPGAQLVNDELIREGHDHQQYVSTDPIERIEAFYDDQDGVTCNRQYGEVREDTATGEVVRDDYLFTVCDIDRSWLDVTQYTTVTIQHAYDDNGLRTEQVIIDVQRRWGD